jgi:hypothetical protein
MTKKFQVIFDVEIEEGNRLRKAWKEEGYDSLNDFLQDYIGDISNDLPESLYSEFDFDITKFKFNQCIKENKELSSEKDGDGK